MREKVGDASLLCVPLVLAPFPVPSETALLTGVHVGWLLFVALLYSMAVNNSPATNRHAILLTADLFNQAVSLVPCIVNCCRAIKYSLYVVNANCILQKIYYISLVAHSSHAKNHPFCHHRSQWLSFALP
jgi:hypothetical protein